MNPTEWLLRTARLTPGAPALLKGVKNDADYATFLARVAGIAGALSANYNIGKGDRVAIFMSNCTEYLEAMYGIWYTGAAVVPINAKLHAKEAAWIIANAGVETAFISSDVSEALIAVAPGCLKTLISVDDLDFIKLRQHTPMLSPVVINDNDLLWLFYTSGTTGRPKGVMISAGNISAMALAYFSDVDEVLPRDAILYAAPMWHGAGVYNFMNCCQGCASRST